MKIKKGSLKDAEMVINKIMNTPIATKTAYRLDKIIGKIGTPLMEIEKTRVELIDKYGEKNEETGGKQVAPAKMKEFTEAFVAALKETVEVDIQLIPYELLIETGIQLSARDIGSLKPLLAEPVSEKK